MRSKTKYQVIYRHRTEYPISIMCQFFGVPRRGYYSYVSRMGSVDKDALLAEKITEHQDRCHQTYGYRRMHLWLAHQRIHYNPETVLRIMKKHGILSKTRRKRKWQNLVQQIHRYKNLLNRQFLQINQTASGLRIFLIFKPKRGCYICLRFVFCSITALWHTR